MALDTLELGRDASRRHAWPEAMDALGAADHDVGLAAGDLELLADAAWWSGQPDAATDAFERAFAAHLEAGDPRAAARIAHYEVGEVRLRMGDLGAAGEAFERAYEHGHNAQPGIARLMLAQGDADEAARSIDRSLAMDGAGGMSDQAQRARILPAQVEIALSLGDLETARAAADELEAIATRFDRPAFRGAALTARGAVLLQEEAYAQAAQVLDRAWRLWQEVDLPYESAQARVLYGKALSAIGIQQRRGGTFAPPERSSSAWAPRSTWHRCGSSWATTTSRRVPWSGPCGPSCSRTS